MTFLMSYNMTRKRSNDAMSRVLVWGYDPVLRTGKSETSKDSHEGATAGDVIAPRADEAGEEGEVNKISESPPVSFLDKEICWTICLFAGFRRIGMNSWDFFCFFCVDSGYVHME